MSSGYVWLNGRLVAFAQATISVADRGFTSGDGVFETMKSVDGIAFASTRHLRRLAGSAQRLGLVIPSQSELRGAIDETIGANESRCGRLARVRVTITGGPNGAGPVRGDKPATVVVTADPLAPPSPSSRVVTVPWAHNDRALLVGAKTTSYAENLAIMDYARSLTADEALIPDTMGRLCEGTTSNVLLEHEGQLVTPTLATGCLPGVTRALALEWGLVVEQDVSIADVGQTTELILSSSTRDLLPVGVVDKRMLPAPGPLGAVAIAAFAANAAANPDP